MTFQSFLGSIAPAEKPTWLVVSLPRASTGMHLLESSHHFRPRTLPSALSETGVRQMTL